MLVNLTERPAAAVLSPARLGQLVAAVAAAPGSWSEFMRFDPARRWYRRLELADDYEVWLLSWLPGQDTGFHDHGDASGAFAVAVGELRERTGVVARRQVTSRTVRAGGVRSFGRRHVHDVGNASARPAVSIHAYAPPLAAMRRYDLTPSGLVQTAVENAEQDW
jgi:predicted metal-dependent enzyme (double-stranded beta helix superfamily)